MSVVVVKMDNTYTIVLLMSFLQEKTFTPRNIEELLL